MVAFIQRCIVQLNGSPGPQANAQPLAEGAQYVERARTADEIKATPAANEGAVSRAPRRFRTDDDVETVDGRGELQDPVQRRPAAPQPQPPQRRIVLPGDPWNL